MNPSLDRRDLRAGVLLGLGTAGVLFAFSAAAHGAFLAMRLDERVTDWPKIRPWLELGVACFAALCWGSARLESRHPAVQRQYRRWLKTTPWHPGRALPLGDPTLQLGDFAMAAILGAYVHFHAGRNVMAPLAALLLGYSLTAMKVLLVTGRREAWPIAWIGGALVLALPPHAATTLPLLAAAYAVAHHGVRRSLADFPWKLKDGDRRAVESDALVWPFSRLAPGATSDPRPGRVRRHFATATLVGWWVFCVATQINRVPKLRPHGAQDAFTFLIGLFATSATLMRWVVYRAGSRQPLSLWGRLVAGRFILPAHDRLWVAPLAIAAAGVGATTVVALLPGAVLPAAAGLAVTGLLAMALLLPPSLYEWQLTGQFHMQPAARPASRTRPERAMT